MMQQGRFPRARVIGGKSVWIESEVDEFLAALPLRQYKHDQR
jgi:predicted DNA-binding transcriptional regulator AlpA